MLMSNAIWAAYGIRAAAPTESIELQSLTHLNKREPAPQPSLAIDTSSAPTPTSAPPAPPINPTTTFSPAIPAAPYAPSSTPSALHSLLSPAAIAGLCIGAAVLVVCAAYIVLEIFVLRRRRRESALRRAVEEVETGSIRSDSVRSEVKSREGWVVCEKEVSGEDEGGRKGMSLPRRMW